MTVSTDERTSVRSGNRVPVPSGPRPAPGTPSGTFTFVEVGTNIDCWNSKEVQGQLALMVTAEVSSAVETPDAPAPVIRQLKWNNNPHFSDFFFPNLSCASPARRPPHMRLARYPASRAQAATPLNRHARKEVPLAALGGLRCLQASELALRDQTQQEGCGQPGICPSREGLERISTTSCTRL
jgi:hypothetical protein